MAGIEMMSRGQIEEQLMEVFGYTEKQLDRFTSKNLLAIELQKCILEKRF